MAKPGVVNTGCLIMGTLSPTHRILREGQDGRDPEKYGTRTWQRGFSVILLEPPMVDILCSLCISFF